MYNPAKKEQPIKHNAVAVFGGSFDPPHIGHLAVIQEALKTLPIDKLIVVPAWQNPFKNKTATDANIRLRWMKAALQGLKKVEISDYEISQNRPVATIETVKALKGGYDKIYLIIGADNLQDLPKWYDYESLCKTVIFAVAGRDDIDIPAHYLKLQVSQDISSTALKERLERAFLPAQIAEEIENIYEKGTQK